MKNLILFGILVFLGLQVSAQNNQSRTKNNKISVPEAVSQAFHKDFPKIDKVHWGREGKDFEGEFMLNGVEASANYTSTGHRTELEISVKNEDLPATSIDYIRKNYADYKIKESAKVTNDKNEITYEVEIAKGKVSKELVFDSNGKFMKAETGDED